MIITSEDVKFIEKAIETRNKGWYIDGQQLTNVYNRVLNRSVPSTTCGSCIRQRINELETALRTFKKTIEVNTPTEEKQENTEQNKEVKKKVGRPPKNK